MAGILKKTSEWFSDVGVCHQLRAEIRLTSIQLLSTSVSEGHSRQSFPPDSRGELCTLLVEAEGIAVCYDELQPTDFVKL